MEEMGRPPTETALPTFEEHGNTDTHESERMKIVGIRTRFEARTAFYQATGLKLRVGDQVIVEISNREEESGLVVESPRFMESRHFPKSISRVLRPLGEADLHRLEHTTRLEKEAFGLCQKRIQEMKLPMKLQEARYTLSRRKATFYFSAEGRVDFRRLVKSLSTQLSVRVEMRQIGVRDEAKMKGGCGDCGRTLCCSSFLNSFDPISVRMAKDQNLSLNPAKLSGACGRLKCCLRFEHSHYISVKKKLPACKKKVSGCDCKATVIRQDLLKEQVVISLETGERITATASDLERMPTGQFKLKHSPSLSGASRQGATRGGG